MSSYVFTTIKNGHDRLLTGTNSKVDSWFLVHTPYPIIVIVIAYLYFVYKFGPRWMANRPAYEMKLVLAIYNIIQIVFNGYLFIDMAVKGTFLFYYFSFGCRLLAEEEPHYIEGLRFGYWLYLVLKILDLFDTVFFILRKKQRHISFLHVWHHASMIVGSWINVKYLHMDAAIIVGYFNSFVHVILYTYYLIASLGPKYRKYIWWKKYLTQIQLAQFVAILFYGLMVLYYNCGKYPYEWVYVLLFQGAVFFVLFGNFYMKAYLRKDKAAKKAKLKAEIEADEKRFGKKID